MSAVVTTFAEGAAAVDRDREAAFTELGKANARGVTSSDLDAFSAAMDDVAARTEALRKRFYPRAARLVIALGMAATCSPKGRRSTVVWDSAEHQIGDRDVRL